MNPVGDDAERKNDEVGATRLRGRVARMSTYCRDCREGLDHCHGTIVRHWMRRSECTEDGCTSPELVPHAFVVDCDAVGCGCAETAGPPARGEAGLAVYA